MPFIKMSIYWVVIWHLLLKIANSEAISDLSLYAANWELKYVTEF